MNEWTPSVQSGRKLMEWSWAVAARGNLLHHLAEYNPLAWDDYRRGKGRSTCGRAGNYHVPGFLTRMTAERCNVCCDRLGYPRGVGSPKNDDAVREAADKRIATLLTDMEV